VNKRTVRTGFASALVAVAVGALIAIGAAAGRGNSSVAQYQYPAGASPTGGVTGQGQGKTTICHHTGSSKHPWHTITVANPALPAHLRHGDTIGSCGVKSPTTTASSPGKGHGKGQGQDQGNGPPPGKGHSKP